MEDIGETLTSIVDGDDVAKRQALPGTAESRKPRPAASRRLSPSPRAVPSPPEPPPGPSDPVTEGAPPASSDSNRELPEAIHKRIRALGKRRRSKPLRQLILDICTLQWATVGELSEWLGMDASNLRKRQLGPLVKSGRLRLQYPENKSHPEQAYRATGA